MKIAIPLADGRMCLHFGHCESFALVDVYESEKKIVKREDITSPPHQPGLLPGWLRDQGAGMIIAGGMGVRAQDIFKQMGIDVLVGAPPEDPETLVRSWLEGRLAEGDNVCDH